MRILLEIESIIEKKFYFKGNAEINVGKLFNNIQLEIIGNLDFLKNYDPHLGISGYDVEGFDYTLIAKIPNFEKKYIFFSPYMRKETKNKLLKIFNESSNHNNHLDHREFQKIGWDFDEHTFVLFGEIKATILDTRLHKSHLIKKVKSLIKLDRDEIIRQCGYIDEDNVLSFEDFYDNFCEAIDLTSVNRRSTYLEKFLKTEGRRITPIVGYDGICGGNTFFISDREGDCEWNIDNWDFEDEENMNGPFEVGNPNHGSKGYYEGYFDYESAIEAFSREDHLYNLLRPAFDHFDVCSFEDVSMEEYLKEYGEHPKILLDLMKKIKKHNATHGNISF